MRATCWWSSTRPAGVPKSIFDAVDALATKIDAWEVAVGNPDDPAAHFATICKPGSMWHVETISAFDTPAYTGEKVPGELLPLLVSPNGSRSASGGGCDFADLPVTGARWISGHFQRHPDPAEVDRGGTGADDATYSSTAHCCRHRPLWWGRDSDHATWRRLGADVPGAPWGLRDIDDEVDKNEWVTAVIDVPGVGGWAVDRLIELRMPVTPYNGGEAAIDKERFLNARAEDYWTLRELFKNGEIHIDPDDDKLAAQLRSIKWGHRLPADASRSNPKTTCARGAATTG
jgi:hypothetical protein